MSARAPAVAQEGDQLLTPTQVAKRARPRVGRPAVMNWIHKGIKTPTGRVERLGFKKRGGRYLVPVSEWERFNAARLTTRPVDSPELARHAEVIGIWIGGHQAYRQLVRVRVTDGKRYCEWRRLRPPKDEILRLRYEFLPAIAGTVAECVFAGRRVRFRDHAQYARFTEVARGWSSSDRAVQLLLRAFEAEMESFLTLPGHRAALVAVAKVIETRRYIPEDLLRGTFEANENQPT